MLLNEVVTRNRRRQLLVVAAAWINWCLFVGIAIFTFHTVWWFFGPGLWLSSSEFSEDSSLFSFEDLDVLGLARSLLLWGLVVATGTLVYQLYTFQADTLSKLDVRLATPDEVGKLQNLLAELAIATGTDPVQASVLDDDVPKAMSLGDRPHDMRIVVTSALLRSTARDELEAVLAVELYSIRRLDTAMRSTVLACTSGPVHWTKHDVARGSIAGLIRLFGIPSRLLARWLRRHGLRADDFGADDMAVAITRNPDGRRRVLEQLHQDRRTVSVEHAETVAALWFEPLAVVDSTTDESGTSWTASLRERIERLPVGG